MERESDESDEDDEDRLHSTEYRVNLTDQASDEEHRGSNGAPSDQDDDDESAEEEDQRQHSDQVVRATEDHGRVDHHEQDAVEAEASSDAPAEQLDIPEAEPEHDDQVDAESAVELVDPRPIGGELSEYSSDWRLAAAVPLPPSDGQSSSSLSISFPGELHSDPPHPDDEDDDEDEEDEMY